ncbi:unnamed protein product [Meganyctiphanes norvegica]|uniref:Uncharacterized protein n=1 Tax=Meganyctiphanes norvegica TaxID=48144 RepID=A0AAV2SSY4_MEGNR
MAHLFKFIFIKFHEIFVCPIIDNIEIFCNKTLSSSDVIFRLILVSSANNLTILFLTFSSTSDIIMINSTAAKTVPWGPRQHILYIRHLSICYYSIFSTF